MTGVVFGPTKAPTTDWRWQEVLSMEPLSVMAELRELDVNLFAARSELREAVRELAVLEDTLHKSKQQALDDVMGTDDQELADKLFKGGTKGERAQRQETYLVALDWVSEAIREIEVASIRKDNAQVAFDSLLDRQTNLGRFANMYAATARLLASIRPPEEGPVEATFEATLYFVAAGKPPLCVLCVGSEEVVTVQRRAREQEGYQEVSAAEYSLATVLEYREPVFQDEVLDAMEAGGVEVPVETELGGDDHDEGEYGVISVDASDDEVEIPVSMEVSAEDAKALEAAIKRHSGEVDPEEVFPSDEDLPFQPDDEAISL